MKIKIYTQICVTMRIIAFFYVFRVNYWDIIPNNNETSVSFNVHIAVDASSRNYGYSFYKCIICTNTRIKCNKTIIIIKEKYPRYQFHSIGGFLSGRKVRNPEKKTKTMSRENKQAMPSYSRNYVLNTHRCINNKSTEYYPEHGVSLQSIAHRIHRTTQHINIYFLLMIARVRRSPRKHHLFHLLVHV